MRSSKDVCVKLAEADVKVDCFGSAVANWSKDPRSEADFQSSYQSLKRAIPRMQRLGTKMIRGMSFAVVKDGEPDSPALEKIIFEKVRRLVRLCEEGGVTYVHENCANYGGLSYLAHAQIVGKDELIQFPPGIRYGQPGRH